MKILLNGATGGTNFGDFLFSEAFQKEVSDKKIELYYKREIERNEKISSEN